MRTLPVEGRVQEWLKPDTEAITALQNIVFNPNLLGSLHYLVEFLHTGNLEVYHALYNKWAPKRLHFSYQAMVARSQLAVIDFNLGAGLEKVWRRFGAGLEKVWRRFGAGLEKVWRRFGAGLEKVWRRFGAGLEQAETSSGSNKVSVK